MHAESTAIETLFSELEPDPERPAHLPDGVAEMALAEFTDGPIESGVWTCTSGGWDEHDTAVDEVMVILDGRVRITDAIDGTSREVSAGDLLHIPKGWSGRWDVLEPMRKLWFIPSA